ncbi:MAG: S4 domain-containing protein, partial [Hominenteromicrobium sp.]
EGFSEPLPAAHSFQPVSGVVASDRLDCLVALISGSSREKAAQMIAGGLVSVNHRETLSASARVAQGDTISIRRCGRFILDSLGPKTKKGRLSIKCRKYI